MTRTYRKKADTIVAQLYTNKYLIAFISCTFKCPVMFLKMNVKNDSKRLKHHHKSAIELGTPSTLIIIIDNS